MRPSVHDTSQPHHVRTREDDYGDTVYWCNCGKTSPTKYMGKYVHSGGRMRLVNPLHEHIKAEFDGRCHFKRYGMECGRHYGHRGLHKEVKDGGPRRSRLVAALAAALARQVRVA